MIWASIDPGKSGTGIAIWEGMIVKPPIKVIAYKFVYVMQYMFQIERLFRLNKVEFALMENATYFKDNLRGSVCLTSGSLIKLAQFIGGVQELCRSQAIRVELVFPMQWKGQLSKDITLERILKIWPDCPKKPDHLVDAVAIGYWKLGAF